MSVYFTALAKAVEFAADVQDNIERQHEDDLRSDDVHTPAPLDPDLSVLMSRDGVAMLPSDAAEELEQYMAGVPAHCLDGPVIHSDTLCNLRGWR